LDQFQIKRRVKLELTKEGILIQPPDLEHSYDEQTIETHLSKTGSEEKTDGKTSLPVILKLREIYQAFSGKFKKKKVVRKIHRES
jgi:hypothetical protein